MTQRLAAIKALSVSTSGLNDSALALFLKEKNCCVVVITNEAIFEKTLMTK